MRQILSGILAGAVILSSAAASASEKNYDANASFHAVKAGRGVIVRLDQGERQSILARTDADDFSDLTVEIKKGVLLLRRKTKFNEGHGPHFEIHVTTVELSAVTAATGAQLETGDFFLGDVSVKADTGGIARMSGSCVSLDAEAATGGVLDAGALECQSVKASASTGGAVTVRATEKAEASARLGGEIDIYGAPALVRKSVILGGDIELVD